MTTTLWAPLANCRAQFPSLQTMVGDKPAVFLDGPAGTQVPQRVVDAMSAYMIECNANHGGMFATSVESDARLDSAHMAYAEFVGGQDPDEISFGQNMTSLTFAFSRAIANTWNEGDEIIVTQLDHDANVAPWVLAARDRNVKVQVVAMKKDDCTVDQEDFRRKLNSNTKLVAIGAASNASGSVNPLAEMIAAAHAVGALTYIDAVHYAPHRLIDIKAWDADFVAFSAYKFFGPHIGILWGRRNLLEDIEAYKVRPASDELPGKWMSGTQSHESIMGAKEAVDYLADLGREVSNNPSLSRREALVAAFEDIQRYEQALCLRMLEGLEAIDGIRIWGITDRGQLDERLPTISITHDRVSTTELARQLGQRGLFVWNGHYYAIQMTEALGLEPEGMIRLGLVHYNTPEEVDRLLEALARIVSD